MHRILLAVLLGVLSGTVQAQQATSVAKADGTSKLGTNWSWEAKTRIRNEIHENPAGTEGPSLATRDYQFTEQKTTLGLHFNRGEAFKGHISLIHAFNWGMTEPAMARKSSTQLRVARAVRNLVSQLRAG